MIVVDASAVVEALVGSDPDDELLSALDDDVHAPHLLDVEVTSVLRGLALGDKIPQEAAVRGLEFYWSLSIVRHELHPLSGRVWALRHQFTSYDASYLALAEALGCPLLTADRKLTAGGHSADVRLV